MISKGPLNWSRRNMGWGYTLRWVGLPRESHLCCGPVEGLAPSTSPASAPGGVGNGSGALRPMAEDGRGGEDSLEQV